MKGLNWDICHSHLCRSRPQSWPLTLWLSSELAWAPMPENRFHTLFVEWKHHHWVKQRVLGGLKSSTKSNPHKIVSHRLCRRHGDVNTLSLIRYTTSPAVMATLQKSEDILTLAAEMRFVICLPLRRRRGFQGIGWRHYCCNKKLTAACCWDPIMCKSGGGKGQRKK